MAITRGGVGESNLRKAGQVEGLLARRGGLLEMMRGAWFTKLRATVLPWVTFGGEGEGVKRIRVVKKIVTSGGMRRRSTKYER
jgi:hypothetical protein